MNLPKNMPQAAYFQVFKCGGCPNAHIVLLDDNDKPFAQLIVGRELAERLAADINHALNQEPGLQ